MERAAPELIFFNYYWYKRNFDSGAAGDSKNDQEKEPMNKRLGSFPVGFSPLEWFT